MTPARLVQVQADLYERLGEMARGGLGKISRARDLRSGRIVAIKEVIGGGEDIAVRFAREAMITANLQHPAIVPVYEVGRWPSGEPFYAMKLVKGRPFNEVIDGAKDLDARLALLSHVLTVADALAYAHGERVIHRDLKPHNVLCGAHGETVVIDWGLARRLDDTDASSQSLHRRISAEPGQTFVGAIMGTPAYMPPEQARGVRVDERADVYAIGALLYHLLAGAPAYTGRTLDELLDKVKAGPPERIADRVPEVPPDLAAIVERAMAREPDQRYPSAAELAHDLRRFTTGQLVLAHRYTTWQRLRRFIARNRAAVLVGSAALAALSIGGWFALSSVFQARDTAQREQARAETEKARADGERDAARTQLVEAHSDRARVELAAQRPAQALAFIVAAADAGAGLTPQLRYLAARAHDDLAIARDFPVDSIGNLEPIPGSEDLLVASDKRIVRWDPGSDRVVWEAPPSVADIVPLGPREVAVARGSGLAILDVRTGAELRTIPSPRPGDLAGTIGFDPARRWLVSPVTTGGLRMFDVKTGTFVADIPVGRVAGAIVSPDGMRIVVPVAVDDTKDRLVVLDRTGRELEELCGNCRTLRATSATTYAYAEFSTGVPPKVVIRDWSGARLFSMAPGTVSNVTDIELAEDGKTAIILTNDGMIEAHDRATGLRWRHTIDDRAYESAIDARGRLWVLGAYNSTHAFEVATGVELGRWGRGGIALRINEDGHRISVAGLRRGMTSWTVDATTVESLTPSAARVWRVLYFDDHTTLVGSDDGNVYVLEKGKPVRSLGAQGARVANVRRTPEGNVLSTSKDGTAVIRSLDGKELERYAWERADVSPDGKRIAVGKPDGSIAIIDRATKEVHALGKLPNEIAAVRWSPDGTRVAAIDFDARVLAWTADGVQVAEVGRVALGLDVVFSPDSKWLVPLGDSTQFKLISMTPGVPDRNLDPAEHDQQLLMKAAFTRDGAHLALAEPGRVRVFAVPAATLESTIQTSTDVTSLAWSSDGSILYGGALDKTIRVWGMPAAVELLKRPVISDVYGLELDEDHGRLAVLTLGPALQWNLRPLSKELPSLRALVACQLETDPVTNTSRTIDVRGCNALAR